MITEDLYIIPGQKVPLLSRSACEKLKLISLEFLCVILGVSVDDRLFKGLGCVKSKYSITLRPDVKLFAIHMPRPISFPQQKNGRRGT